MAQRTDVRFPTLAEQMAAAQTTPIDLQTGAQNFLSARQQAQQQQEAALMAKIQQARQLVAERKAQQDAALQQSQLEETKRSNLADEALKKQALLQQEKSGQAKLDAMEAKQTAGKTLPAVQAETIGNFRGLIKEASNVRDIFEKSKVNGDSPFVGPKDARVQGVKQFIEGSADPKAAEFKGSLASIRNRLLNLLSGAAISPAEFKRLNEQLPDDTKSETDFTAKLQKFQDVYKEIEQEKIGAFQQAGFDVSGFTQQAQPVQPTQNTSGSMGFRIIGKR